VIRLSEDDWPSRLYPDDIRTLDDYVQRAGRLHAAIAPHVAQLLGGGLSVVLDFPANTVNQRRWMRALIVDSDVAHELHYLDLPDTVYRARLHVRNAAGEHPFTTSDEAFDAIARHFVPPGEGEFHVIRHRGGAGA
jgi:predicted kinase